MKGGSKQERLSYIDEGYQLEKLEFALAIAEARGDKSLCISLLNEINNLGGNSEEPGTWPELSKMLNYY